MSTVRYQTMPPLSPEEYRQLEASCIEHGIQVPILVDENGSVIDGHHRQKIAQEHGLYLPTETRDTLTDAEKTALSISLNIDRRQLTREQRREIIAASLRAQPEKPDFQHAKALGVSPTTVGVVRREMVDAGDISNLEIRTDAIGRERPTSYSRPVVAVIADAETGEVVEDIPAPRTVPKGRRRSLVDDAYTANTNLWKAIESIRAISKDDRFTRNKADILAALQPSADLAIEILTDLFNITLKEN